MIYSNLYRRIKYLILPLTIVGIIILSLVISSLLGYRLNLTHSMPIGLWRVINKEIKKGNIVIFCPPIESESVKVIIKRGFIAKGSCSGSIEPLLKPIAAIEGDTVKVTNNYIEVNNVILMNSATHQYDGLGNVIPSLSRGTYHVRLNEIWLISDYNKRSFDSRYFGPITKDKIIGVMEPVWTFQ